MTVRTRFAPSPTGYMHIGGMRTALFNWLWARHNGGQFILRIDDTDQQRNLQAALDPILHAFRWLGLNWDEGPEIGGPFGPYFQSQRGEFYKAAAEKLLLEGKAFKDFDPPEVVQADRKQAEDAKRTYLNVRRSIDLTPAQIQDLESQQTPYVIRLLVDRGARVSIEDEVRGHVEWDCSLIADPVIMRSNGTPLYNFASVVDDIHLQITHVIRAEEHLTNTAVQALLFSALGSSLPSFAHIPFVAAPGSTKKLSKRDVGKYRTNPQFRKLFEMADKVLPKLGSAVTEAMNPVMVSFYEEMGFLPDAIVNCLARLGWSLDDKTEVMSRDFVIQNFTLDRVVKASAGLDTDKLIAFQEHWMGQLSVDDKVEQCLPYLQRMGFLEDPITEAQRTFLRELILALGDRLKVFSDIANYEEFFLPDDSLEYDTKAIDKRLVNTAGAVDLLKSYQAALEAFPDFTPQSLEAQTTTWLESEGKKLGDLVHGLRLAVSGKTSGPGLFECLSLLGRESCRNRITLLLTKLGS